MNLDNLFGLQDTIVQKDLTQPQFRTLANISPEFVV